jgi:hypothetical protein
MRHHPDFVALHLVAALTGVFGLGGSQALG